MLLLPTDIVAFLAPFAPLFSQPVWRHVQVLLVGAILAPGRRMVSTVLRAVGLNQLPTFQTYHRVLNRAVWSSLDARQIMLGLLVTTFAATVPLVVGIDATTSAPARPQDRRHRHLPRSGPLQPFPLRQG